MTPLQRPWVAVLLVAAIVRLFTLGAYPLHDTTEARYAEVARLMVTTDDWITPQIEPGTPFWAKPPLSIWLTAASFEVLGQTEFAARLPALLWVLLTIALTYHTGRKTLTTDGALAACTILLTSGVGYVSAGAVMTDASLLFATTLSLVAFWLAACEQHAVWRYLFFAGLGLGLLAKGPVAIVLVGLPVLAWSAWHRGFRWFLQSMPWFSGGLLMLAVAAPWYWLNEHQSPGFLAYYIVGEHWLRFMNSGWQGDLYGNAHAEPRGTIWLFAIGGLLPWSLVALYAGAKAVRDWSALRALPPFHAYLLFWMLTPLAFFTFAANILPAYVLPGLPAFALLLATWLQNRPGNLHRLGWVVPLAICAVFLSGPADLINRKSQKDLIAVHESMPGRSDLYYFPKLPYSASFYSGGRAAAVRTEDALSKLLATPVPVHLAMRKTLFSRFADSLEPCVRTVQTVHRYVLLQTRGENCRWVPPAGRRPWRETSEPAEGGEALTGLLHSRQS